MVKKLLNANSAALLEDAELCAQSPTKAMDEIKSGSHQPDHTEMPTMLPTKKCCSKLVEGVKFQNLMIELFVYDLCAPSVYDPKLDD